MFHSISLAGDHHGGPDQPARRFTNGRERFGKNLVQHFRDRCREARPPTPPRPSTPLSSLSISLALGRIGRGPLSVP